VTLQDDTVSLVTVVMNAVQNLCEQSKEMLGLKHTHENITSQSLE